MNNYRWKRGQDEYDAWHASGVSGNTVRSFYVPDSGTNCMTCHMPLTPSNDRGNDNGYVRSHRFAVANTALPTVNDHSDQLQLVRQTLQDSVVTVDLFIVRVNGRIYGPDETMPVLQPGDDVELTVVVRNRKVGHGFPGGTNDSNELWLELTTKDPMGRPLLISGDLDAEGRVDSTAHFWGAVLVDRASHIIDKRNAQDWKSTVYTNVISPGTAHTVHYRFKVPQESPISEITATFRYRKFTWYFNQWVFRGRVEPGQPDSLAHPEVDLRSWTLDHREAPVLPITDMANAIRGSDQPPLSSRPLWERWNDYGIGLLMEGDLKGAMEAFGAVARLAPEIPEGPINQARVLVAEGQFDRAVEALHEADRRVPDYLKADYFKGVVFKARGQLEDALAAWMRVFTSYPEDRVVLSGIGRLLYLLGRYEEALVWFDKVLIIDPEDIGALYNRTLSLGALGRDDEFAEAQARYLYHKEDDEAFSVTAQYKRLHPMANREAQPLHKHELRPVAGQ